MARSEARIAVSIWSDPDFIALSPLAQRMFLFLLSQPDLAHDGVLALRERRWSRSAAGLTPAQVSEHLDELAAARFVVIDEDTEELLIRSFIRRDKVYRQPNVLRAAADHLEVVASPIIRAAIAEELRRISQADDLKGDSVAIVADMLATLANPSGNPSPNPSRKPSGTPADGGSRETAEPSTEGPEKARTANQDSIAAEDAADQRGDGVSAGKNPSRKGSRKGSENPSAGTPGDRGIVTAVSSASPIPYPLTPIPPTAERAALAVVEREPDTAQTLVAEWIDHCRKRPPGNVIGQVARLIKAMLAEGIDPADIRRGLAAWHRKGLHPSTLPSVVNEVMQQPRLASVSAIDGEPLPVGTATSRASDALRLAAHYAAIDGDTDPRLIVGGTR